MSPCATHRQARNLFVTACEDGIFCVPPRPNSGIFPGFFVAAFALSSYGKPSERGNSRMNTSAVDQDTPKATEENAATRTKIEENAALAERLRAIREELRGLRKDAAELSDRRDVPGADQK